MTDHGNPPAYTLPAVPQPGPGIQSYHGSSPSGQNPALVAVQASQPVQMFTIAQAANIPTVYENYRSRQSKCLGIIQIIAGVLCIVFNAVGIAAWSLLTIASIGIWGGILFIITGAFGVSAAKLQTKCKVITFLVLNIISATVTVPLFICAVIGAIFDDSYQSCYGYGYSGYGYRYSCRGAAQVAVAMNALLAVLAIIEAVAAIWGSVICCKAACCCRSTGNEIVASIQYATIQGQQVIIIPQSHFGGQMMMTYSPPEYSTQQIPNPAVSIPYPPSYGQEMAAAPPAYIQSNNSCCENLEKQLM